jgi:hypothetical protein
MVVGQDHSRCIRRQCCFHDFTWMDATAINRAPKHLLIPDDTVPVIEKQTSKEFMLQASKLGGQIVLYGLGVGQGIGVR